MIAYFDNAATTPLDDDVFDAMLPYFKHHFGNPSSSHMHGRSARHAVETSRKTIANLLHAAPDEIVFTSGGTEADNTAIFTAIRGMKIKHAVTSKLEHHAVLNTLKFLEKNGEVSLSYVSNDENGNLSMLHLEEILQDNRGSFVSIMHGNNEVGNINDISLISSICKRYNAVFHTDTVQTMGHYPFDLTHLNVHFLVGSAHKFHGPKGVGFLYVNKSIKASPYIFGGPQEKMLRAGTENVPGIVGMAKALEISYRNLNTDSEHIKKLKHYCIKGLKRLVPDIKFNGNSASSDKSLYTVISIAFPKNEIDLLASLDMNGISVSGGSACNSASHSSHVLTALNYDTTKQIIRLSFSKYNSASEVNFLVEKLALICKNLKMPENSEIFF